MTEFRISDRFDDALMARIAGNLARFKPRELDRGGRKHAAVAFTLVDCAEPAEIGNLPHDAACAERAGYLLTTRASKLNHHASQRAFPGGRIDEGESIVEAALRELEEEVGLRLNPDHILGRLDDYPTRSGFVISPIVVWAGRGARLVANPDEVDCIHRVPVLELLRDDAPMLESIPESDNPVLKMPLGDDWFAAPSAAIAYQFREVALLGRATRVAHFEQPYFAWK